MASGSSVSAIVTRMIKRRLDEIKRTPPKSTRRRKTHALRLPRS